MNASSYAPSATDFLNAYLSERFGLEIERPWVEQLPPLDGAQAPAVPAVPDAPVPGLPA
jgi:hypothetical protein